MRTIKCRGKCTSDSQYAGEWVTGGVVICEKSNDVLIISAITDKVTCTYHVKPETVGQYTERKDGKDNEIYDGDILQDDDDLKFVVFWNEMYMEWAYRRIDTGQTFAFAMSTQALRHLTVVGNIHDNPKMLKKEV